jgi:hypothetical protein
MVNFFISGTLPPKELEFFDATSAVAFWRCEEILDGRSRYRIIWSITLGSSPEARLMIRSRNGLASSIPVNINGIISLTKDSFIPVPEQHVVCI